MDIAGSSDAAFRGDKTKHTPEDLFVSTLSTCHMLWYLHLCAVNGVVVTEYIDEATGVLKEEADGSGYFEEVTLNPVDNDLKTCSTCIASSLDGTIISAWVPDFSKSNNSSTGNR